MSPVLQDHELDEIDNDFDNRNLGTHAVGRGLYLNPYYGKGVNERNGEGLGDIFSSLISTGTDFIKNHGSTLANVANIAGGAANTIKAIKDINANDEKLYQLQRITKELEAANSGNSDGTPKISNATLENLKKVRKIGSGTKGSGLKEI